MLMLLDTASIFHTIPTPGLTMALAVMAMVSWPRAAVATVEEDTADEAMALTVPPPTKT